MFSVDQAYSTDPIESGTCIEVRYEETESSPVAEREVVYYESSISIYFSDIDLEIIDEILDFEETEQVIGLYDLFPTLILQWASVNKRHLASGFP